MDRNKLYKFVTEDWHIIAKSLGMDSVPTPPSFDEFEATVGPHGKHGPKVTGFYKGHKHNLGVPRTAETKKKLSDAAKGRKGNCSMLGKKHTNEAKAKMKVARKGRTPAKGKNWKQKQPNTKLSEIAKKRYKVNLPDGKWTWGYRD